jgi:hypothetical protein
MYPVRNAKQVFWTGLIASQLLKAFKSRLGEQLEPICIGDVRQKSSVSARSGPMHVVLYPNPTWENGLRQDKRNDDWISRTESVSEVFDRMYGEEKLFLR